MSLKASGSTEIDALGKGKSMPIIFKDRPEVLPEPTVPVIQQSSDLVWAARKSSNPSDPIQSNFQQLMLWAIQDQGHWALAMCMYSGARHAIDVDPAKANSYWKVMVKDYEEEHFYAYLLLLSLPKDVIVSIIKNTLTYDAIHDRSIGSFKNEYMRKTSHPGVYMNILARDNMDFSVQPPRRLPDAGKWLSANEVTRMLADLKQYLDVTPAADLFALEFDGRLPISDAKLRQRAQDSSQRRYAPSNNAKKILRQWAKVIAAQYLRKVPSTHQDVKFLRCPTEVGWSMDISTRLRQHTDNGSTTYIYGWLNTWVRRYASQSQGGLFPTGDQSTIFRVWAKDIDLAQVAEFTAMLLTSSQHGYGGLNAVLAGNISLNKTHIAADDVVWRQNALNMFSRPHIRSAFESDMARRSEKKQACEYLDNELTINADYMKLDDERNSLQRIREELKQSLIEKQQQLKKLSLHPDVLIPKDFHSNNSVVQGLYRADKNVMDGTRLSEVHAMLGVVDSIKEYYAWLRKAIKRPDENWLSPSYTPAKPADGWLDRLFADFKPQRDTEYDSDNESHEAIQSASSIEPLFVQDEDKDIASAFVRSFEAIKAICSMPVEEEEEQDRELSVSERKQLEEDVQEEFRLYAESAQQGDECASPMWDDEMDFED